MILYLPLCYKFNSIIISIAHIHSGKGCLVPSFCKIISTMSFINISLAYLAVGDVDHLYTLSVDWKYNANRPIFSSSTINSFSEYKQHRGSNVKFFYFHYFTRSKSCVGDKVVFPFDKLLPGIYIQFFCSLIDHEFFGGNITEKVFYFSCWVWNSIVYFDYTE